LSQSHHWIHPRLPLRGAIATCLCCVVETHTVLRAMQGTNAARCSILTCMHQETASDLEESLFVPALDDIRARPLKFRFKYSVRSAGRMPETPPLNRLKIAPTLMRSFWASMPLVISCLVLVRFLEPYLFLSACWTYCLCHLSAFIRSYQALRSQFGSVDLASAYPHSCQSTLLLSEPTLYKSSQHFTPSLQKRMSNHDLQKPL